MKIFDIKEELQNLDKLVESIEPNEDGELIITDSVTARIFELHEKKDEVLLYLASKYKELIVEADGFKSVIQGLQSRKKTVENRAKWLAVAIKEELKEGDNLKNSQSTLSWRKSEAVEILNIDNIPDRFLVPDIKADIAGIKKELKLIGNEVDGVISSPEIGGCQIRKKMNLQIK